MARVLAWRPLRDIGRISYGLYLWHWPIIVWLTAARMGFGGPRLVAVRLAVTFAAAILSFRFVEDPIRHGRWWSRRAGRRRFVAPVAVAVLLVVLVASSVGAAKPPAYLAGPVGPCPEPSTADVAPRAHSLGECAPAAGRGAVVLARRAAVARLAMRGDEALALEPAEQGIDRTLADG